MKKAMHGGPRSGAGRKPGAAWNGSGEYQKRIKTSLLLTPTNYHWLRLESRERDISMAQIINEAIDRMRES